MSVLAFAHWTPDSGTVELPIIHRGIPLADAPTLVLSTEPIDFPWLLPPVPTRPPKRVRRRVKALFGGRA